MNRSAFLPALSVLALAAGFAPATCAQSQLCASDDANCRMVKVTVQGNQVVVDPPALAVTGRRAPAVKIVWVLATPGYKFVDASSDRPVNFPAAYFMSNDSRFCYPWTSDTVYVCTDWNADYLDTDYTLKVVALSGSSPVPATARVVNN